MHSGSDYPRDILTTSTKKTCLQISGNSSREREMIDCVVSKQPFYDPLFTTNNGETFLEDFLEKF